MSALPSKTAVNQLQQEIRYVELGVFSFATFLQCHTEAVWFC